MQILTFLAYDMSQARHSDVLKLRAHKLNQLLKGGLHSGTVVEFAGPSGVGKTQWCIQLVCDLVCSSQEKHGGHFTALYVDTESALRLERIVEVLSTQTHEPEKISECLSKIHIIQPSSIQSMTDILNSLELMVIKKKAAIVVIDSIASLTRKEFSGAYSIQRTNILASWVSTLKEAAHKLSIFVIVTNQVTTRFKGSSSDVDANFDAVRQDPSAECESQVTPALGISWTHFINTRFILQYGSHGDERELLIAKSPVAPVSLFPYRIVSSGILLEDVGSYTYAGIDSSKHSIRTHSAYQES